MDTIDRKILEVTQGIFKNVKSKTWKCLIEGCENNAINSHLLQRNGILNYITENGTFMK